MVGRTLTALPMLCLALAVVAPSSAARAQEPAGPEVAPAEAPAPEVPEPVLTFTLPQAVEYALHHNPAMAAQDAEIEVYEAKLVQALSGYVPRFKLTTLLSAMPAVRGDAFNGYVDRDEWGPFLRIELEGGVPIYSFGKLEALHAMANAGIDVAEAKRRVAVDEITYQAKRAFYGWQFTRELRAMIDDGKTYLDKAKKHLEEMEARDDPEYDQIDMLKVRVYEGDIRGRELELDKGAFMAFEGMRIVLGLSNDARFAIAEAPLEPLPLEILPVERYVAIADRMRPELEAARAGVRASEGNVDLRFAKMLPSLGIVGSYAFSYSPVADDQRSPFSIDPYNGNGGGAVLGLEWELDIMQKIGEYDEARASRDKALGDIALARSKLLLDVKETWQELRRQSELIGVQARAERAARGWLIAKSDLHDAGFATMQDVVDALLEYYKRKMGHIEAVYNFNLAVVELSRRVGVDVTTLTKDPEPPAPE